MTRRIWLTAGIASILLLAIVNPVHAQEAEPQSIETPQVAVGTAFTYQGQLQNGGVPFNGSCDFHVFLYDSVAGTGQVGTSNQRTAPVTNGLFTIPDLDFGSGAFDGNARWLRIDVRCPAGGGIFTTLTPRQLMTPVPYAIHARTAGELRILESAGATYYGIFDVGDLGADQTYTFGTGGTVWTSGNDGPTSGLNADLLDNQHGSYYQEAANLHGTLDTERYSAYGDLGAEGYLNGDAGNDLLTLTQSDGRFWRLGGNAVATDSVVGTTSNYALDIRVNNIRALRLQPNATSPSLIGGFSGNWVASGTLGATVGGGGRSSFANRVTDDYGTVGGGSNNQAGDNSGATDTANGTTVAGGWGNKATSSSATIGGGESNEANAWWTTVAGGMGNIAGSLRATVGGGGNNEATGGSATIAGGWNHVADGQESTVGGGKGNVASGVWSTIPGGVYALADHTGQMAYSQGSFDAPTPGTAQASLFVMRNEAAMTAGVWNELFLDGYGDRITVAPSRVLAFDILIVGHTEAGESGAYRAVGAIENVGGTTAFVGTPTVTVLGENDAAWNAQVVADNTRDALIVQVQGNGETIRWVATVRTAEVAW